MSGVRLIIGLELKRLRNQFSLLKSQRVGMRKATSTQKKRGWFFPFLMMLIFMVFMLFTFSNGTKRMIRDARPALDSGRLVVSSKDYRNIWFRLDSGMIEADLTTYKGNEDPVTVNDPESKLMQGNDDLDEATAKKYVAHFRSRGLEGFVNINDLDEKVRLSELSKDGKIKLSKSVGIILLSLMIFVTLSPIAMRYKDLASEDVQLEMLFGLPLSNRTILTGRFLSMCLVRPSLLMMVFPFLIMLFYWLSLGFWSVALAVFGTMCLGVFAASVELLTETILRAKGTQKMKKNVQSSCLILGTLGMYLGFACMISLDSSILEWLVDSWFGDVLYYLGAIFLMPAGAVLSEDKGVLVFVVLILSMALIVFISSILVSGRSLSNGLTSGGGMQSVRSLSEKEKNGGAVGKLKGGSKYEWLVLSRDRALMTQLLAFPLLMLVYQWLMNPKFMEDLTMLNVGLIAFGIGSIGVTMSAPALVMSELKSLWVVFTLPMSVAHFFRRRSVFWGGLLTGLAILVVLVMKFSLGVSFDENTWRVVAAVVAVFVLSRVSYAIMLGNVELPDAASAEVMKLSQWRFYLCMGVSGICGIYIYQGEAWEVFACLVIFWYLGDALWENLSSRLRYIHETIHDVPEEATLVDALKVILIYFLLQSVLMAVLFYAFEGVGMLFSFIGAGVATYLYSISNSRLLKLSEPETCERSGDKVKNLRALLGWTVLTSIVGVLWLNILFSFPNLEYELSLKSVDLRWYMAVLMIVVAPLVEEYIFRKLLFGVMLKNWGFWKSVFSSALLFAVVHPSVSFPPVFLLGVGVAWLYGKTGKLIYGITLHAAYNAVIYAVNYTWVV